MKYFREIIIFLSAIVFAKFAVDKYLNHQIIVFYSLVVSFIVLRITPWSVRFYIMSLLVYLTFSFPKAIGLPFKWWSEFFAVVLFCILVFELLLARKALVSSNPRIFFIALGIFILWNIFHYIMNPVGGRLFGSSREEAGLRQYAIIVTGTCTFFVSYWMVRYKKINFDRMLFILLVSLISIGILRILGFTVPLLGDAFISYKGYEGYEEAIAMKKYRSISGMRLTSMIGMSSALAFYYKKKGGVLPVITVLFFIACSILGGGRGIFWGILFAIGLYLTILNRKIIIPVVSLIIIIGGIFPFLLSGVDFDEWRYGRVFSLEGGYKEQDRNRYYTFLYMMEIIKDNPIMGKGIGYHPISSSDDFFNKYPEAIHRKTSLENNIRGGGHGSYLSIASIAGIGGIFFIAVMVFGTMYYSYKTAVRNDIDSAECRMALFVFIYISILAVHMINGGDGIEYRDMWFLPGIIAGIISRHAQKRDDPVYRENRSARNFLTNNV